MKPLFLLVAASLIAGCASKTVYVPTIPEAVSQGVYGAYDAVEASRFALADKLLTETKRIVPAPKVRLEVVPSQPDDALAKTLSAAVDKQTQENAAREQEYIQTIAAKDSKISDLSVLVASLRKYQVIVYGVLILIGLYILYRVASKFGWLDL